MRNPGRDSSRRAGEPVGRPCLHPTRYLGTGIASFRSRRSALSDAQRETWERLWPELGISVGRLGRGSPVQAPPLDTRAWFGRQAPLVLEIGCGSGTSTLAMAKDEPDIDVIAVEIYRRGLAQLLCAIDREQVSQHPVDPRERGRRAAAPDRARLADRGPRLLPRSRGRKPATTSAGFCNRPRLA